MDKNKRFFVFTSSITSQERIDFCLKINKQLGVVDENGGPIILSTEDYSDFTQHPSDESWVYTIDERYFSEIGSDPDYHPIANFVSAIDDNDYSEAQVRGLGFFPDN